jgi:hypothetical protein
MMIARYNHIDLFDWKDQVKSKEEHPPVKDKTTVNNIFSGFAK